MKLTLSMIVKNETHIIKECFDTIHDQIDYWVIVDTGSTDGTQEFIKNYFAEKGIPGELHERPWVSFGHNRTEALELCNGKADYIYMIDADDYLEGKLPRDQIKDADGYAVLMGRMDFSWWRTQIFKANTNWRYVGILHEYPTIEEGKTPTIHRLEGEYRVVARTLGARNVNVTQVEKYSKDAILLEEELAKDPTNSRYQFYLAQSYFDSQQWEKATEAYLKRVALGGWEEECYYSLFRVALVAMSKNDPWGEIQEKLLAAFDFRPCRAEALHVIARYLRMNNKPRAAYVFAKAAAQLPYPVSDILFIDTSIYKWMCLDELGSVAYYSHDYHAGHAACELLLKENRLPPSEVERVQNNLNAYKAKLQEIAQNTPPQPPITEKPYIQKTVTKFKKRK